MKEFFSGKYRRFGIVAILYLLVVIWIGNYWLLLGIGIIYDLYITEKVNWTFWKKRHGKNSAFIEWLDALIFAVIAVTLINIFLFQNYRIPTPSMEKSLLVGDHLLSASLLMVENAEYPAGISVYAEYHASDKGSVMVKSCFMEVQASDWLRKGEKQ